MDLLIQRDALARGPLIGTFAVAIARGAVATPRRQDRRFLDGLMETVLLKQRGDAPADRNTKRTLVAAQMLGLLAAIGIAQVEPLRAGADNWETLTVGLVLILAGYGLRIWGVWELGSFFRREVVIQEGQHIVDTGPYRWIRHPAYLGNLVTFAGIALAIGTWPGVVVMAAIVWIGCLPRIRVEERALAQAFPQDWPRFAAARPRLTPGVW